MELGISSLGDIIDFGLCNKWKNVDDLLSKSTEVCLNFAEEQDIAVVEIVIDPQNIFIDEIKQKLVGLIRNYKRASIILTDFYKQMQLLLIFLHSILRSF